MSPREPMNMDDELLAAYLELEVTAAERSAVESALTSSPATQKRLETLRDIRSVLSAPVPALETDEAARNVMRAIARASAGPGAAKRWPWWGAGMAAVAAAALFAIVRMPAEDPSAAEFRARSFGGSAREADRWAGVQVRRVDAARRLTPLSAELAADDALVFSYTNLGPEPFPYLMVFAVDASGEVRWFHPAFEREGTDPRSVAIGKGSTVSLGEAIGHDYAAGPLAIYALFTREALHVSAVEKWLSAHAGRMVEPPAPGASLQLVNTRIVR